MNYQILLSKLKDFAIWLTSLDYANPRILLTLVAFIILPLIAKYMVLTGLLIALMLSVSLLWLVEKSPLMFKQWVHRNPLMADLGLSTFAILSIGSFLGPGVTLAIGFVFLDIILAMTLPAMVSHSINKAAV